MSMRDLVIFDNQPCGPCMGTGFGAESAFGISLNCPACKGKKTRNHVQLPNGTWSPVADWRRTEMGIDFFHVIETKGVALTWNELRGSCAYARVAQAENDLDEIKRDLAPFLSAA
jgi:hypothetical protein